MQEKRSYQYYISRALFLFVILLIINLLFLNVFHDTNKATSLLLDKILIRTADNETVYWLQNNKIYGVYESSFNIMRANNMPGWTGSITIVSSINGYVKGPDFIGTNGASNGMLIKLNSQSQPTVYEIYNGYREALSSNAFSLRGYSLDDVIEVPSAIFNNFVLAQDGSSYLNQSPADGTIYLADEVFTMSWNIRNNGQTTWTGYEAYFIQSPSNGNSSVNLTHPLIQKASIPLGIKPGGSANIAVTMKAPSAPGTYYSYWQIRSLDGSYFGVQFFIKIVVYDNGEAIYGLDRDDFGNEDSPGSNAGINDDSLNTATGNFNYQATDLNVASRGLNFVFSRSYNAQDKLGGPFGVGWSHSYNIYLLPDTDRPGVVTIHYGDGKRLIFIDRERQNLYKPVPKGYYDLIFRNPDNSWSLFKPDLREFRFNHLGYLQFIKDRNNNQITLTYNGFNSIEKITDTVGREYVFSYTDFLLTQVTDPIGRTLQFGYTNQKLTLFKDARLNSYTYSYDAAGLLKEVTDGRGTRILTNTYDNNGRLISQRNGRGHLWQFNYDIAAKTTYVIDPNSKQITYKHDAQNKLLSFTNRLPQSNNLPQSNRTSMQYDQNDRRSSVTDPLGSAYSYLYTDKGYIRESKDPLLKSRTFDYGDPDNPTSPTSIKDELQNTTSFSYDSRGNLLTITNAINHTTRITYNQYGQPLSITDPELNETKFTYDIQGNLKTVTGAENNVTTFNYDGVGRRTSMTNPRGKTTTFTYDNNDSLLAIQRPIGGELYNYDGANNLTSKTDAKLNLTTFEYDENSNLVKEIDPTRTFYTQHTYDPLDRRIKTRDKRGNTTNFEYDEEGRLLSVTEPFLNKTGFAYDGNGNRKSVTDANNQKTEFTYDELNRLKEVKDPLTNKITKEYDEAGRLIKETDGRLSINRYTYDKVNNLTQIDDAEGGIIKYVYDKNNNLIQQLDPVKLGEANKISKFTYDKVSRLISSEDPLGNTYIYTYDGMGNRLTQRDAKQQLIKFTYDDNERLETVTYPDNSVIRYFYDANDNLIRMEDALGISTYTYDSQNRLLTYKDVYDKTISYSYDPNGNISVITYPDGKQVEYEYDSNNRMRSLTDWGGRKVSYEYTALNQLKKITPPATSSNGATTYSYDDAGRLIGMVNAHTQGPDNTYSFILDQNGNRTSISVQEPLNNIVRASSQNYAYDAANRIQNAGSATFTFDNNGNMTSKTQNGDTTNFTYDFNDRLISHSVNTYSYNGQGIRVAKKAIRITTRYVVDINQELPQVICETDSNGNITNYYVYGQGLVYKVKPDGTHYYYQFDPNGSTVSITTENDSYVNRYTYDSFGNITNSLERTPNSSAINSNSFTFGGRFGLMDDGLGLIYVRARYYSPELGRFLNKDPLTGDLNDGQSLNRFIYALNNPIRKIDPDGMKPWDFVKNLAKGVKAVYNKFGSLEKIGGAIEQWGIKNSNWAYKINANIDVGIDAKGLGKFVKSVGKVAKVVSNINLVKKVYDNAQQQLGGFTFNQVVDSWRNAGSNLKFAYQNQDEAARAVTTATVVLGNTLIQNASFGKVKGFNSDKTFNFLQSNTDKIVGNAFDIYYSQKQKIPNIFSPQTSNLIPITSRGPKPIMFSSRGDINNR